MENAVTLTLLSLPTFLSAKVGVPAVIVTVSPLTTPLSVGVAEKLAVVVPSYVFVLIAVFSTLSAFLAMVKFAVAVTVL